jgi:hypothetical protein
MAGQTGLLRESWIFVLDCNRHITEKTYTDAMSLPLFGELEKITPLLPSLIASLKSEILGLKDATPVQKGSSEKSAEMIPSDEAREILTELVPALENFEMAERGGFEPPIRLLTV